MREKRNQSLKFTLFRFDTKTAHTPASYKVIFYREQLRLCYKLSRLKKKESFSIFSFDFLFCKHCMYIFCLHAGVTILYVYVSYSLFLKHCVCTLFYKDREAVIIKDQFGCVFLKHFVINILRFNFV